MWCCCDWYSNVVDYVRLSEEFNAKLKSLKDSLMCVIRSNSHDEEDLLLSTSTSTSTAAVVSNASRKSSSRDSFEVPTKKRRKVFQLEVDFAHYCQLMRDAGLQELASPGLFRIFDVDGNGTVNMKEFLLALLALRSRRSSQDEDQAAELYFSLFDVNEDGFICPEEMVRVVAAWLMLFSVCRKCV